MEPGSVINEYLKEGLDVWGLAIPAEKLTSFVTYFGLLLAENQKFNLISPKQDLKTKVAVHLLDSLSPLLLTRLPAAKRIMDFGSGGGLPGIPLSLVWSYEKFDLVESTGKKARFLSQVVNQLDLKNVSVINDYLEPDRADSPKYDLITTRAVSALGNILAIAGPRLTVGGYFLAFKGPQVADELSAAGPQILKYGLKLIERKDFSLPLVSMNRTLLLYRKI